MSLEATPLAHVVCVVTHGDNASSRRRREAIRRGRRRQRGLAANAGAGAVVVVVGGGAVVVVTVFVVVGGVVRVIGGFVTKARNHRRQLVRKCLFLRFIRRVQGDKRRRKSVRTLGKTASTHLLLARRGCRYLS